MVSQKVSKCFGALCLSVCFIICLPVHAFGSKKPKATPPADPSSAWDDYLNIGRKVDDYRSDSQLIRNREPASHPTDSCTLAKNGDTFAEIVGWGINEAFDARPQELDYIASPSYDPYQIYNPPNKVNVSLMSHRFCSVSESSLQRNMSTSSTAAKMPSSKTIQNLSNFVSRYNSLRDRALQGNPEARADLKQLWVRFMGCLSYIESLGDPDTSRSESISRRYAPSGYERPQGVNFYIDPNQSEASKLNIGLFQFAPGSNGNIQSCIRRWNKKNTSCKISEKASSSEMIRILGSAKQVFNSFCGTSKILDTLYVQANSKNSYRTDNSNIRNNNSLKSPSDRCVSLNFRNGRSYNHFGPLHNSTGTNLGSLMSCVMFE